MLGHNLDRSQLSPDQQKLADEATVFVLAGAMLQTYQAVVTKSGEQLSAIIARVGMVLRDDPGFIERFTAAQIAIMKTRNAATNPPPTDHKCVL